jgi:integrase
VPADTVLDVMEQCIDPDTRLVFALGRFAGLRTPKECRTIKPEHINFDERTLKILDCKKKKYRTMPLFDQVFDELILHRSKVKWGRYIMSSRFLTRADANNWNLMKEAIDRTEHQRWVDLRQNLRSSCVNHLLEAGFEEWEVCAWLGHSVKTSRKHYQKQTTRQLQSAVERLRNS